jgi:hypothetical protein
MREAAHTSISKFAGILGIAAGGVWHAAAVGNYTLKTQ